MGAADVAYEAIRSKIVSGEFATGARLPEEELAVLTGVSRTPVREALRLLASEGLVEFTQTRRAHVATWSEEDLADIFELRALLESYGANLASQRLTAAEIAHMSDLADRMEAALQARHVGYMDEISALNHEFHQQVLAAAGSARLRRLLGAIVQMPLTHHTFSRLSDQDVHRSFDYHRELITACGARDAAWAESVMRAHILAARRAIV